MDHILEKLNILEKHIEELKVYINENLHEEKKDENILLFFYKYNSEGKFNENDFDVFELEEFDTEVIKQKFSFPISYIKKEFRKNSKNLHAKRFTSTSDVLLITDSLDSLIDLDLYMKEEE